MVLFRDLPPELRLKIWRSTIESRLVSFLLALVDGKWQIRASTLAPIALQVNRESRAEILSGLTRIRIHQRLDDNLALDDNLPSDDDRTPYHRDAPNQTFVEAYFNPALDTLSIEEDGVCSKRDLFDARAFIPLIKQARARHVRLYPAFWLNYGFAPTLKTIMRTKPVETLTFYHHYGRTASAMFRIVNIGGLPRTAVASLPPPNFEEVLDSPDGQPSISSSLAHPWTFAPVRELLHRDGAVIFNHKSKSKSRGLALLLVVDEATFPDEFIWALAARAALTWRHDDNTPQLPSDDFADEWRRKVFSHIDGVCVPSFRLGGEPPYIASQCDNDWKVDVAAGTMARIAQNDLRMPFIGVGYNYTDRSWQFKNRKVWMEAILWGKGIKSWEEAREGGFVDARGALGDTIGTEEREEIERVVGRFLAGGVWRADEATAAQPVPGPFHAVGSELLLSQ